MKAKAMLFSCMLLCGLGGTLFAQSPSHNTTGTKPNGPVQAMPPTQLRYEGITPLSPASNPTSLSATETTRPQQETKAIQFTPKPGDAVSGPRLHNTTFEGTPVTLPAGLKMEGDSKE